MREDQHFKFQFISGSTLKILALVTMIIDHIGASFLESLIVAWNEGTHPKTSLAKLPFLYFTWMGDYSRLWDVYWAMRLIGRIAFPIYCFLLVEGIRHTHNKMKYAIRLGIFALVSEVPFNLAFFGQPLYWDHQNVFWTLLFAFLAMWMWEQIWVWNAAAAKKSQRVWRVVGGVFASLAICMIAECLNTDYGFLGVACTLVLYGLRKRQLILAPVGAFCFWMSESFWTVPLSFIPVLLYNGKRGLKLKVFFYVMYPLHLLILGLLRLYLGI
jgi:hypothetical protein